MIGHLFVRLSYLGDGSLLLFAWMRFGIALCSRPRYARVKRGISRSCLNTRFPFSRR